MCHCLCVPSDQEYVEGYRVQIVSLPLPLGNPNSAICNSRLGSTFTIQNDVAFDNKVSLLNALLKKLDSRIYSLHGALSFCSVTLGQPKIGCSWDT